MNKAQHNPSAYQDQAAAWYRDGQSMRTIATRVGVHARHVRRALVAADVPLRERRATKGLRVNWVDDPETQQRVVDAYRRFRSIRSVAYSLKLSVHVVSAVLKHKRVQARGHYVRPELKRDIERLRRQGLSQHHVSVALGTTRDTVRIYDPMRGVVRDVGRVPKETGESILRMLAAGASQRAIAAELRVSRRTVRRVQSEAKGGEL